MSKWTIYNKEGQVKLLADSLEYHDTWMGEEFVTVNITSATPIELEIGDYLTYRGSVYTIYSLPTALKQARSESYGEAFKCDGVKLSARSTELSDIRFFDVVLNDNNLHYTSLPNFSFYAETVDDLLDRILANTERSGETPWFIISPNYNRTMQRYPLPKPEDPDYDAKIARRNEADTLWRATFGDPVSPTGVDVSNEKTKVEISIDNKNVFDILQHIKNTFGLNFITRDRNLIVGGEGISTENIFKYGKGKGLYQIERSADTDQQVVTKLFAYGSDKNIPTLYYAQLDTTCYFKSDSTIRPNVNASLISMTFNTSVKEKKYYTSLSNNLPDHYLVKLTAGGVTVQGYFDYENGTINMLYNPSGFPYNPDWIETDYSRAYTFATAVNGKDVVYVASTNDNGINVAIWPGDQIDYSQSELPNNMSVNVLMLPGFPKNSLSDLCKATYDSSTNKTTISIRKTTSSSWGTLMVLDGDYSHIGFSSDRLRPFITSPNLSEIGIKEGDIHFIEENDDNGLQEVCPSVEGMTENDVFNNGSTKRLDEIVACEIITDNGKYRTDDPDYKFPNFHITLPNLGFELDKTTEDSGGELTISMKDGYCGGRDFKVHNITKKEEGGVITWDLEVERCADDTLSLMFPYSDRASRGEEAIANEPYQIQTGDHYVLTGINITETSYIWAASVEALRKAIRWLLNNDYTRFTYLPKVDEKYMKRQDDAIKSGHPAASWGTVSLHDTLKAGMLMAFQDSDLNVEGSVFIDQLTIKEDGDNGIPTYDVVLRNDKQVGTLQRVQNQINSLSSYVAGGGGGDGMNTSQIRSLIKAYGGENFLSKVSDDIAQGVITFAGGLVSKVKAVFEKGFSLGTSEKYGADGEGNATLKSVGGADEDALSIRGGANVESDLNIGGNVDVAGQERVDRIQSHNYSGSGLADTGYLITNDNGSGSSLGVFDYLTIRKKMIINSLEIKETHFTAGDVAQTLASAEIARTDYFYVDEVSGKRELLGYSSIIVPWSLRSRMIALATGNLRGIFGHYKKVRMTLSNDDLAKVNRIRCYFKSKDGEKEIENWFRVNDLVRCQTWNVVKSKRETFTPNFDDHSGNIYYWRKIEDVSWNTGVQRYVLKDANGNPEDVGRNYENTTTNPDAANVYKNEAGQSRIATQGTRRESGQEMPEKNAPVEIDGNIYHWFDVQFDINNETGFADVGSDIPAAGDKVVQFGNTTDPDRMNIIMQEVNGSCNPDAPAFKMFRGVYSFDMDNCWWGGTTTAKIKISPSTGVRMYAPMFEWITEHGIAKQVFTRQEVYWTSIAFERDDYTNTTPIANYPDYSDDILNDDGTFKSRANGKPKNWVRKCRYYEQVTHNGSVWLSTFVEGYYWRDRDGNAVPNRVDGASRERTYTTQEPAKNSAYWTEQVEKGDPGAFKSSAFCRTNTDISNVVPQGGTIGSPIPTSTDGGTTWSDDVPDGTAKLWMTTAWFYSDGTHSDWTAPRQQTDTETLDIEFSPNATQPLAPVGTAANKDTAAIKTQRHNQGGENMGWFDPNDTLTGWTWSDMKWRAERKIKNGVYYGSWAITRIKGENSVRIDLSNENDSMLYDNNGTLLSGYVYSTASLYDGSTDVSTSATWEVTATNCTRYSNIDSRNIVVSAMSEGTATVNVKATYTDKNGTQYIRTTQLTLKKLVNQDKYDLDITPNALFLNTTEGWSGSKVLNVKVMRTPANGGEPTAVTPSDYGLSLNASVGTWGGSWPNNQTLTITQTQAEDNEEAIITLYEGSDTSKVHDRETVPFNKAENGKSITKNSETVRYQVSDSGTTVPSGTWYSTRSAAINAYAWTANRWMWTRTVITWSDNSTTTLYTQERNPNDGIAGQDIIVDGATVMKYYVGDSNTTHPSDDSNEWKDLDQVTQTQGKWLWSQATTWYRKSDSTAGSHDAGSSITYNVSYISKDGKTGRGISSITEYYQATNSSAARQAPSSTTGWSTDPNLSDLTNKWDENHRYLWNMEEVVYSNVNGTTTTEYTIPQILAIWTEDGEPGHGIDSIQNKYCITNSASPIPVRAHESGGDSYNWTNTPQTPSKGQFLWNYEIITWVNPSSTTYTEVQQIGYSGTDGTSPWIADLDNEMDSIACDKNGHPTASTTVQTNLSMFYGSTRKSFTVSSVTINGNATKTGVTLDYTRTASTAIAFSATYDTTATISGKDDIAITLQPVEATSETRVLHLTINGVLPGPDGTPATIYSLVPSCSEIAKKKNGTTVPSGNITCSVTKTTGSTPETVTTGFVLKTFVDGTERTGSSSSTVAASSVTTNIVYELYNAAGAVLLDRETIPVVADGTDGDDGQNSLRLDLNNEMDSILYDGTGNTKISADVTTEAFFYDGVQNVSTSTTFSIYEAIGVGSQGDGYTFASRVLTVKKLTQDTGIVTIKAEYNGYTRYATFTVKKLCGIDKYDLIVTPNAVGVNTSETLVNKTIEVEVMRTAANGGGRSKVSFNADGSNTYGLVMTAVCSDSTTLSAKNQAGTKRIYEVAGAKVAEIDNIVITISRNSLIDDTETIPINHVHNGVDGSGSNAVKIDLDNEMDSIPCDSGGVVMSTTSLVTSARIYNGASAVTSGVTVKSVDTLAGVTAVSSVTDGVANVSWTIAQNTSLSLDKYTAEIVLTWNGNDYYGVFTANVVKSGKPGKSPTIYNLMPSLTEVSVPRTSNGGYDSTNATLKCGYRKVTGNETPVTVPDATGLIDTKYYIYFRRRVRGGSFESSYNRYGAYYGQMLSPLDCSIYDLVEFILCTNSAEQVAAANVTGLIDKETVPVVADGEQGGAGYSIVLTLIRNGLYTDANWDTYAELGHTESYIWRNGDGDFTVCRIGDYFIVSGTSSDSGISHTATYKCTSVSASSIAGICVSHTHDGEPGTDGTDGNDAINVKLNPENVIITQSDVLQGGAYPLLVVGNVTVRDESIPVYGKTEVKVFEGDVEKTGFTIGTPTSQRCTIVKDNDGKTIGISAVGTDSSTGNYYQNGEIIIPVTYGGKTYNVRFNFYCNLLGNWRENVIADTKTEIGNSTWFDVDANGNIVASDSLGTFIRSSKQNTSQLNEDSYYYVGSWTNNTVVLSQTEIDTYGSAYTLVFDMTLQGSDVNLEQVNVSFQKTGGVGRTDIVNPWGTYKRNFTLTAGTWNILVKNVSTGADVNCLISNAALYVTGVSKTSVLAQTVGEISATVYDGEIGNSALSIRANGISSQVSGLDGRVSDVEQTADGLTSTVKGINPSKNLLKGVLSGNNFGSALSKNFTNNPSLKSTTLDTDGYITVASGSSYIYQSGITIERGKYYTMSFELKSNQTTVGFCVFNYSGDGTVFSGDGCDTNCLPKTSGKKKTAKFKVSGTGTATIAISLKCSAIRYPQLEEGEAATDFVTNDKEISSGITQSASNIQLFVKDDFKTAGIDITSGSVVIQADKVSIKNGSTTAAMFVDGKIKADFLQVGGFEIGSTYIRSTDTNHVITLNNNGTANIGVFSVGTSETSVVGNLKVDSTSGMYFNIHPSTSGDAYIGAYNNSNAELIMIGINNNSRAGIVLRTSDQQVYTSIDPYGVDVWGNITDRLSTLNSGIEYKGSLTDYYVQTGTNTWKDFKIGIRNNNVVLRAYDSNGASSWPSTTFTSIIPSLEYGKVYVTNLGHLREIINNPTTYSNALRAISVMIVQTSS